MSKITAQELSAMSASMYGDMVKAVVDLKKKLLIVDAEMHVDEEDLWGINLYPNKFGTDQFVEFDSMINIRPRQNNKSRSVEDEATRKEIINLVQGIVADE